MSRVLKAYIQTTIEAGRGALLFCHVCNPETDNASARRRRVS